MNKLPPSAWHNAATALRAAVHSEAIQSHIFAKRKTQIYQKDLSGASMQKGRTHHHPFDGQ
jgi:hypothetical protein